ncbi:MAG: MFS transporter [Bacteroidales bacterium]
MKNDDIILGKNLSDGRRWLAFLSIIIIYFFYCYNFMLPTFTKVVMTETWGFTKENTSWIFGVMSLGTIPGTFIFGWFATNFGKKRTLIVIALLIAATTALPFINPTSVVFWRFSRFLTGVTLGGVFGTAVPLVAELFPQKYRGKLAAACTATFSLAMIFGGFLYDALGAQNWGLLTLTAIIPPVIGAVMTFFFVPDDADYMKTVRAQSTEKVNYFGLFKGKYAVYIILAIVLSGMNFVAYSSFTNNFVAFLQTEKGITTAGKIFAMQGFGQLAGYFFWGAVADKFGRKVPRIGFALAGGIILYSVLSGISSESILYVIAISLGVMYGFSGAWGAYYSEMFPSKYRAMSAGLCFNGGRIISSFALPYIGGLADASGTYTPYFTAAVIASGIGVIFWSLLPETLGKSADEIYQIDRKVEAVG